MNDHSDALVIDTKFSGYFSHGVAFIRNILSNLYHLTLSKFVVWVLFPKIRPSTFGKRIFHVFRSRAHEQMFRVAALRIVTVVATVFIWINGSISEFVSNSLSIFYFSTEPKSSISLAAFGSSPWPTLRWVFSLDFGPEIPFHTHADMLLETVDIDKPESISLT